MPFNFGSRIAPTKEFNDTEIERFEKFGFDKKLIEAKKFKYYGFAFYIVIIYNFLTFEYTKSINESLYYQETKCNKRN